MILCICFGCPMSYCQWVLYVLVTVLTDDDDEDMIATFVPPCRTSRLTFLVTLGKAF